MRNPKPLLSDEGGFTILEALISTGILMIAIMGANMQYISQLQAQAGSRLMMQNRAVLNQAVAQLVNSPSLFPRVFGGSSGSYYPAVFVACYYPNGSPMPNTIPSSGTNAFVSVFYSSITYAQLTQPLTVNNVPNGTPVCKSNQGGFEVHISWVYAPMGPVKYNGAAQVNSVILQTAGQAFKAANNSLQTYVWIN